MYHEALRRLRESAVSFLNTVKAKPENDFASCLEMSVSLHDPARQSVSLPGNESKTWEGIVEVDGIPLGMSVKLKSGKKMLPGALHRLRPFAVNFLETFGADAEKSLSDSMNAYVNLYEAAHNEDPDTEPSYHPVLRNKTLLRFSVDIAADDRKMIGRKFESIHKARELAVQFLYSLDTCAWQDFAQSLELFMAADTTQDVPPKVKEHCRSLVSEVWNRKAEIDGVLLRVVTGWRPERMVSVDRTILRLMILEGFLTKSLPVGAAITEAKTLADDFGTKNSSRFVNGVMYRASKYFEGADAGHEGSE